MFIQGNGNILIMRGNKSFLQEIHAMERTFLNWVFGNDSSICDVLAKDNLSVSLI